MKFAYLIMAHDNPRQLMTLLKLLDNHDNDIFLHIDTKSNINKDILTKNIQYSRVKIYREYDVKWAGISQTKCQFFLLEKAIESFHDYYHLLSGHDLPLKTNEEIKDFFEKNYGKEFIHFESTDYTSKNGGKYYYFGDNYLSWRLLQIQKVLGINRKLYCGANWFSITHSLAVEFCSAKRKLLRLLIYTSSSDEYVLQTFLKKFARGSYELYKCIAVATDYSGLCRLIDWNRGTPYVWRKHNFDEIIESNMLYARKFDEKIDQEIIDMIVGYLNAKKK